MIPPTLHEDSFLESSLLRNPNHYTLLKYVKQLDIKKINVIFVLVNFMGYI